MAADVFMAKLEGARQVAQLPALAGKTFTLQKVTAIGGLKQTLFLVPQAGAGTAGGGIVALQVEGARQAASFSTLVGKSVTVGQAPTVIGGGKWLVLHPAAGTTAKVFAGSTVAGGAAGAGVAGKGLADSSMIMMKVEGAKQAVQLPMMSGKTFTVVKPMAGAGDNMLALKPVGAMGAAGKGAGAAGAAGKGAGAMGAAGKGAGAAGAAGKSVISLEIQGGGGKLGALVGKTFTVGKAPVVAGNAGKWLVLQPTTGAAAKAMAGTAVAAPAVAPKAAVAKAIMVKGVAGGGVAEGAGVAAKAASGKAAIGMAGAAGSAKAAAGSTIWTGSGWSLGLGLGLGPWGPAILGLLGMTAVYGYLRKRRSQRSETDDEIELPGTLTET